MSLNMRITKLEHEAGTGQECPMHSIIIEDSTQEEPGDCSRCGRPLNDPAASSGKRLRIVIGDLGAI